MEEGGSVRKLGFVALATAFAVGCTPSTPPAPSQPGPSTPLATSSPTPSIDVRPGAPESPGPTAVPSRDITVGGTLTLIVDGESASFADIQCDVADGLAVVAEGAAPTGMTFTVGGDGDVGDMAFTLPSGRTGLLGGFAGEGSFSGDRTDFRVTGRASTIGPDDASVQDLPFTVTGSCLAPEPGPS
jgi:hypothetical protein